MDQNSWPLEIENKVNVTLLINKDDAIFYRTKNKKIFKGYGFLSFVTKYKKQILDKGLDVFKNLVLIAGEFIGNEIADPVTRSNNDKIVKQEPIAEIIISPENWKEILNQLRRVL